MRMLVWLEMGLCRRWLGILLTWRSLIGIRLLVDIEVRYSLSWIDTTHIGQDSFRRLLPPRADSQTVDLQTPVDDPDDELPPLAVDVLLHPLPPAILLEETRRPQKLPQLVHQDSCALILLPKQTYILPNVS